MRRSARLAAVLITGLLSIAASAEDAVIPEDGLVYCTVCHGVQLMGNQVLKAPRISGLDGWYVKRQLLAFKNGWRGTHDGDVIGREMQPMAAALSDVQIDRAVTFVAATRSEVPARIVRGDVENGAGLYTTCAACHGAVGEGNEELGGPALAAMNDWYLVTQLRNYRAGYRGSHQQDTYGQQMRAAIQVLPNDAAIADVVAYIATLGQ